MARQTSDSLFDLVSGFLTQYMVQLRGLSEHTRRSYAKALLLLLRFAATKLGKRQERLCLEDIDVDLVEAFIDYLEKERNNSVRSRNQRLCAIRVFFKYVALKDMTFAAEAARIRELPGKRHDVGLTDYLTRPEVHAILDAPDRHTQWGTRDRALLVLTYSCGLRVSEALGLTLSNVHLGLKPSVLVMGKGRRERETPLTSETADNMRGWFDARPSVPSRYVFLSRSGGQLTRDGFAYTLSKYCRRASLNVPTLVSRRVYPHILRHSCAMAILEAGGDPRFIANFLGHATMDSVEVYLHASTAEKERFLSRHGSLGLKPGRFSERAADVMALLEGASKGTHILKP